jgi:hypothetical protein
MFIILLYLLFIFCYVSLPYLMFIFWYVFLPYLMSIFCYVSFQWPMINLLWHYNFHNFGCDHGFFKQELSNMFYVLNISMRHVLVL